MSERLRHSSARDEDRPDEATPKASTPVIDYGEPRDDGADATVTVETNAAAESMTTVNVRLAWPAAFVAVRVNLEVQAAFGLPKKSGSSSGSDQAGGLRW